eukprot:366377-Chlamydomonas_euryale.AAC.4
MGLDADVTEPLRREAWSDLWGAGRHGGPEAPHAVCDAEADGGRRGAAGVCTVCNRDRRCVGTRGRSGSWAAAVGCFFKTATLPHQMRRLPVTHGCSACIHSDTRCDRTDPPMMEGHGYR